MSLQPVRVTGIRQRLMPIEPKATAGSQGEQSCSSEALKSASPSERHVPPLVHAGWRGAERGAGEDTEDWRCGGLSGALLSASASERLLCVMQDHCHCHVKGLFLKAAPEPGGPALVKLSPLT